jgi:hemolysin III
VGTIFERSHNTERALTVEVRPALRGVSHRVATPVAVVAAGALTMSAAPGAARWGAAVFGAAIVAMFGISALVHARRWEPHALEILFRLDHTGIYLAIAGTATPVALLAMDGWQQAVVLGGVWGVATVGIVVEWLPFRTPRGLAHGLYLGMGWVTVPFLPVVISRVGWIIAGLLMAGGVVYTVGAVIVAIQRPDPSPRIFGYHELWHLLVIVAVVCHYVMVAMLVGLPGAA